MMIITYCDDCGISRNTLWYVGQPAPILFHTASNTPVRVQADGDELYYILLHMRDLPTHGGAVHVGRGDYAAFIADNIAFDLSETRRPSCSDDKN